MESSKRFAAKDKPQRYASMSRRSRKICLLLSILAISWIFLLIFNMMMLQERTTVSSKQQEKIEQMSQHFIEKLAKDTVNTYDGPLANKQTGYQMKKTLAILLEDLIQRIHKLEAEYQKLGRNNSKVGILQKDLKLAMASFQTLQKHENQMSQKEQQKKIDANELIMGAQEDCSISFESKPLFPHCDGKMAWLKEHWQDDSCFADLGVDGTECSFRSYLSEVENWCPLLPGRSKRIDLAANSTFTGKVIPAVMNFDLQNLLNKLVNPSRRPNYDWIRQRITQAWPAWVAAGKKLQNNHNYTVSGVKGQKNIMIYLGFLSKKSHFKMAENSLKGGPLGELVQWSDVITSIYLLGHNITIASEYEELSQVFYNLKLDRVNHQCDIRSKLPIDAIFTDLTGVRQIKIKMQNGYPRVRCLFRVLDSFGTEPAFNYGTYARLNRKKTTWGMQNLDPRQFFTMFPHTPDNSFMGFVVENHLANSTITHQNFEKNNQAVVYGKAEYMWMGKESYLDIFHKSLEIHATVYEYDRPSVNTVVPKYVHNHGVLPGDKLHTLLRQSKIFIGLGFPYEGPAPLEAIAQGNVFINPKFDPPHSSLNTKFFKGKPTTRGLTSQHPYAEQFIGEPNVRTVDMDDNDAVRTAIKSALNDIDSGKISGFIPHEYTHEGMLQRVGTYIQKLDFCSINAPPWPPKEDIQFILSNSKQSCKDACWQKGLICERSYFEYVNSKTALEKFIGQKCPTVMSYEDIYFPAYREDSGQCVLQKHFLLFSCVGEQDYVRRLCPCRTFIKHQSALCKSCL